MAMKVACIPNQLATGLVLNATRNGIAQQVNNTMSFSAQVTFTGTPTGSFHLEASNDPSSAAVASGQYSNPTNAVSHWSTIANSTFVVSAAGDVMWDYDSPGFNWVRIVYNDSSSGASTAVIASAVINIKGF